MPILLIPPPEEKVRGEKIKASPESRQNISYHVVTTWFLPRLFAS